MARHFKTKGSGITEHRTVSYSGSDIERAMETFSERWNADLAEGGEVFGADTLRVVKACRALLVDRTPPFEVDSPEHFAARILDLHHATTVKVQRGETDLAASCALSLGRVIERASMKFGWEGAALRGLNRSGPPSKTERNREMASEFDRRRPTSKKSAIALMMEIGAKHGLGRSAAFEAIRAGRKKASGNSNPDD